MKYAFMSFSCPALDLDEVLAAAKRFGYDGVELRTESGHKHGAEVALDRTARKDLRRRIADSGVALCCVATSHSFANPATNRHQVAESLKSMKLASDLGARCLRVFGGKIPEGVGRRQATDLVSDALKTLVREGHNLGVVVCLETHDDWCDPAHVVEIMRRVNHTSAGVNWDIMHPVRVAKKSMDEAYAVLKPWIRHVHFHDGVTTEGTLRMVPIGTGEVDHRRALTLLREGGFDGFLSGEWIGWEPWDVHLPRELATMKEYETGN